MFGEIKLYNIVEFLVFCLLKTAISSIAILAQFFHSALCRSDIIVNKILIKAWLLKHYGVHEDQCMKLQKKAAKIITVIKFAVSHHNNLEVVIFSTSNLIVSPLIF